MRQMQIAILFWALAAFIAALLNIGNAVGDALWRGGMAALVIDIVLIMLWPGNKAPSPETKT